MRAFHPDQIEGIFGYWTADNAVLSGGLASELPDVSRNRNASRSLKSVGAGGAPTYTSADPTFNRQPSVSSSDSNVRLEATLDTTLAQPSTIYMVINVSNAGYTMYWRTNAGNFTGAAGLIVNATTFTTSMQVANAGGALTSVGGLSGTAHVTCCIYNGTASRIYVDDSQAAFASSPTNGSPGTEGCSVVTVGNFTDPAPYSWTTMIAYSGTHDANTRRRVMAWLGLKYGISVT